MANRNQLINIPLNGQLCLNKTKVDIEQFTGWNKINAPIYGGCLSPLNKKQSEVKGDYWDNDGNYYQAKQDGLYKNNELVMEYENTDVEITEITVSEDEELLAVNGDAKVVLLKNAIFPGTTNKTARFYYDDSTYYDFEYSENLIVDVYIDNLKRLFFIKFEVTRTAYNLYYVFKNGDSFTQYGADISIDLTYCEDLFLQVYNYNDESYITVYNKTVENLNDLTTLKVDNYYAKTDYFSKIQSITYNDDEQVLGSVKIANQGKSSFIKQGLISWGYSTVSGSEIAYVGINKNLLFTRNIRNCNVFSLTSFHKISHNNNARIENCSITINKNFFRLLLTNKNSSDKEVNTVVDDRLILRQTSFDSFQWNNFFEGAGKTSPDTYANNMPAINMFGEFGILINNNFPSNISYKHKILLDWFSIDPDFYIFENNGTLYFRLSNKKVYKAEVKTITPKITTVINNRYIITNTSNNYCYDIISNTVKYPFTDYNGRFSKCNKGSVPANNNNYIIGAAINPLYEITNNQISSSIFPALNYYNIDLTYISFSEDVDIFYSNLSENTVAIYKGTARKIDIESFIGTSITISLSFFLNFNEVLKGSSYPVSTNASMDLNPNSNSKFVQTFNNHDLIINGSTSYALNYYNGSPVLLYSLLSGIENLQNTFVLNTSSYGMSEDKIFNISYNNGIASLGEVVANIKGLQFVGALPLRAIFYSPRNRCLYSFGGDAVLVKFIECSDVSVVYKTWYDTSTQAIYFSTNAGLYVMTEDFIYNMDLRPEEIFFFTDGRFAMNFENDSDSTMFLSYERLDENYKTVNIKLESKYYGEGRNLPGVVDCWYIRFFNNGIKEGGTIKVKASALTDTGAVGEEKEIVLLPSSWDKDTDSYYLRFQPHLQKGIGVCLSVDSPFAIMDINCGYTGFDGAAQIGHNNI